MLSFRAFTSDDVGEAARLYIACFNAEPWNDDWSLEAANNRLDTLLRFPIAIGAVALRNRRLVGLAIGQCEPWMDGQSYYLNEMCVDPEEQRRGVGEGLLNEVIRQLRELDVASLYLLTEASTGADSFFRKNGFETDTSCLKLWREI